MSSFTFRTTPSVHVGSGVSARPPAEVAARLGPRVLVVTDEAIVRLRLADPLISGLSAAGCAITVFADVPPEPPEESVTAAAARALAIDATGVVGFGGGSAMDVAKAAALVAGSGQPLIESYGVDLARGPRLPLMLVPTTAGTGSEATPVAILTAGGAKRAVVSRLLIPDLALLDAELTLGLPPAVTAAGGIDAMTHAIESYASASPNRSPLSQATAALALRLLGPNLPRVAADGADRDAREAMLLGSFLAGQAFANAPVAAVHALAYPIGGRLHLPHGVTIALVLPHVLRFNLRAALSDYADIAAEAFPALAEVPPAERALALIDALVDLIATTGLPTSLSSAGLPEASLPEMADEALGHTRLLVNNPRPVTRDDALGIYRRAFG